MWCPPRLGLAAEPLHPAHTRPESVRARRSRLKQRSLPHHLQVRVEATSVLRTRPLGVLQGDGRGMRALVGSHPRGARLRLVCRQLHQRQVRAEATARFAGLHVASVRCKTSLSRNAEFWRISLSNGGHHAVLRAAQSPGVRPLRVTLRTVGCEQGARAQAGVQMVRRCGGCTIHRDTRLA
jgi:hypothetical protein